MSEVTGQDGLRDELVAALEAIDNLADNYELADRLLPVVQRHIDAAREQAEFAHGWLDIRDGELASANEQRDAAVARAEQVEQAVQRVRELHDDVEQMTNIVGTNDYAKGQRSAMRWVAARLRRALAESKVSL